MYGRYVSRPLGFAEIGKVTALDFNFWHNRCWICKHVREQKRSLICVDSSTRDICAGLKYSADSFRRPGSRVYWRINSSILLWSTILKPFWASIDRHGGGTSRITTASFAALHIRLGTLQIPSSGRCYWMVPKKRWRFWNAQRMCKMMKLQDGS